MLVRVSAGILALALLAGCSGSGDEPSRTQSVAPSSPDLPLPARWWQWVESFPEGQDPIADPTGELCGGQQPDDVWFLAGTYGGSAVRTCEVPEGVPVFFPVLNQVCTVADGASAADALQECTLRAGSASATLDGKPLTVAPASTPEPFTLDDGPSVTWGLWAGPVELDPGKHDVVWHGSSDDFALDVRYRLVVE